MRVAFSDRYLGWKDPPGVETASPADLLRVLSSVPTDLGWDWAAQRLVPVLERPGRELPDGEEPIGAITPSGTRYGYGLDMGMAFIRVSRSMAELWPVGDGEIDRTAMANLLHALEELEQVGWIPVDPDDDPSDPAALLVHLLNEPSGYATSALLVPAVLSRILGSAEVVLTAPSRGILLAFGAGTPGRLIRATTETFEEVDPHPLQRGPFILANGILTERSRRELLSWPEAMTVQ